MITSIESINFEPSISLNKFIKEKATVFQTINKQVKHAEFNVSTIKNEFNCTIILSLNGKEIVSTRKADDMHFAVLKAIDTAKRSLRKHKMKRITLKKKINI